jgi:mRNA capping enzyme
MNPSISWEAKTDLAEKETWKQMGDVLGKEGKKVNLMVLDREFRTKENEDAIIENLISFTNDSLTMGGTIIFKTFWNRLVGERGPLSLFGPLFETVEAVFPDYTGTNSSKLCLRFSNKKMTTDFLLAPDLPSLWKVHEEVKAFRSPEEELDQACKLNLAFKIIGVPKKFLVTGAPEMGSILSSVGVPNGMIPEIISTAERILRSPGGALSASVFLCGICSNYIVRTTSLTTSSWHACPIQWSDLTLEVFPVGDSPHYLYPIQV